MTFHITTLGTSSATFGQGRFMTSHILNANERFFLIDCAEATQLQLLKYGIKTSRIDHIFISHLHGDHFYGLIGLLMSMALKGRETPLYLYAHYPLIDILTANFRATYSHLPFPLHFQPLNPHKPERLWEDDTLTVDSVILQHRVPCAGFIFREKIKPRRIIGEKLLKGMNSALIERLKQGEDVIFQGSGYPNKLMTKPPKVSRSYAFCSDTLPTPDIIPAIEGVNLLYHEATFDQSLTENALKHFHSTTVQAAEIARQAKVENLLLGHFSIRYASAQPLVNEAKSIFPNTKAAVEGGRFNLHINEENEIELQTEVLKAKGY